MFHHLTGSLTGSNKVSLTRPAREGSNKESSDPRVEDRTRMVTTSTPTHNKDLPNKGSRPDSTPAPSLTHPTPTTLSTQDTLATTGFLLTP